MSDSAHLFRTVENLEKQKQQTLVGLYQSFIERVLHEHYDWLRENAVTAVVSPCESNERCFVFYFQNWRDADRFRHRFPGAE